MSMQKQVHAMLGEAVVLQHEHEGELASGTLTYVEFDPAWGDHNYRVGDWKFSEHQVSEKSEGHVIVLDCGRVACGHHKHIHDEKDSTGILLLSTEEIVDVCCDCAGKLEGKDDRFDSDMNSFDGTFDELTELCKKVNQ